MIRSLLVPLIGPPSVNLDDKHIYMDALDLYVAVNVSFADAFNAAFAQSRGIELIYSWDTGIDRLPGAQRIEP